MMTLIKNKHVENVGNGRKRHSTIQLNSLNGNHDCQASSEKDFNESVLDESISINNMDTSQDKKKEDKDEIPKIDDLYVALKPFLYCMSFFGMYNEKFLFPSKRTRIAVTLIGLVTKIFITLNSIHYIIQFSMEEHAKAGKTAFTLTINLRIILMIWLLQNTFLYWVSYQFSNVKKGIPEYFRLMQKYCLQGERPVYLDYIKKVVRVLLPIFICIPVGSGAFIACSYMVKNESVKLAFKMIYGLAMYFDAGGTFYLLLLVLEALVFVFYSCAWVLPLFLLILIIQCTNCELESFKNDFSACISKDGVFCGDIGQFRRRYLHLDEIVELINDIFQVYIGITLTVCLAILLLMLYVFAVSARNEGPTLLLFNTFWFLVIVTYMTTLILCADRLTTWGTATTKDIYRITPEICQPKEHLQAMMFFYKVINNPVGISLLGLVQLSRHLLLGITSLLTSFFLLTMEMSRGGDECDCSLMTGGSTNATNNVF